MKQLKDLGYLCGHSQNPYGHLFTVASQVPFRIILTGQMVYHGLFVFLNTLGTISLFTETDPLHWLRLLLLPAHLYYLADILYSYAKFAFLVVRGVYLTCYMHPAQKDALRAYK